ncbi:hypothetical protein [Micromonospora sp. KC723]|uniref:hypothetical protein n=1 Tax=Micromonospora sp. KC723 TaxID=2530381 RepID=UPI0014053E48|nr:hypothetical protein [Micromonospora sp. KC723]
MSRRAVVSPARLLVIGQARLGVVRLPVPAGPGVPWRARGLRRRLVTGRALACVLVVAAGGRRP